MQIVDCHPWSVGKKEIRGELKMEVAWGKLSIERYSLELAVLVV